MSVSQRLCYDAKEDQILGPHTKVLVSMLRGLMSKWKQPIYYAFDMTLSATLLKEVIYKVENIGHNVVACVCDMAGGNRGLFSNLGVTESNPCFANPADERRAVWCFADVPHVLKLLRNHFLDSGFRLPSGTIINKQTIQMLLDKDGEELKIAHKLTPRHINVTGFERQNVRLAAQLFSRTTACAIRYVFPGENEMVDFFQLVNDTFDLLNTRVKTGKSATTSAYGVHLEAQSQLLDAMSKTISDLRVVGKTTLLPFKKGLLMSVSAAKLLLDDVRSRYDASYVLTARVNQDCLENFFSEMRGLGHHYDHPTAAEVKHRFRLLVIAINAVDLRNCNVQRDKVT
jgi:hypothetical protein